MKKRKKKIRENRIENNIERVIPVTILEEILKSELASCYLGSQYGLCKELVVTSIMNKLKISNKPNGLK